MDINLLTFLLCLGAYLVGSIPSGYWFARYFFGIDVLTTGSKNIGATNVSRSLKSKKYFLLIFFLDASKAYLYLIFCYKIIESYFNQLNLPNIILLIAALLLVGNCYSIFLNFYGGKGVSTLFGILFAISSINILFLFLIVWILVLILVNQVGIASVCATNAIFIAALVSQNSKNIFFYLFIYILILIRHRENIRSFIKNLSK